LLLSFSSCALQVFFHLLFLRARSPIYDRPAGSCYPNVYLCKCVCMYVWRKSARLALCRTEGRTAFVFGSFEKFSSSSLSTWVLQVLSCQVTLTSLFNSDFSAPMKIAFFFMIYSFVRKSFEMPNYFSGQLLRKWVYGLSTNTNVSLPTWVGSKTRTNHEKLDFSLSNDKALLWSFLDQQLQAAELFMPSHPQRVRPTVIAVPLVSHFSNSVTRHIVWHYILVWLLAVFSVYLFNLRSRTINISC